MNRFIPAFFVITLAAVAPAAAKPLDWNAVRQTVSIFDPQISPDGTRVVFMRARSDFEKDTRISQLMLINVRTRQMRPLTFERKGISTPRWSPDGSRIAFVAPGERAGASKNKPQIFVLRLDGGEARQVTDTPNGVDNYAWNPGGSQFAYITQDPDPYKKQIEEHLDAFEVGDNDYLHQSAAIPSHLWIVSVNGGRPRRLTSGSWSLGIVDPYGTSDISFSPDGNRIAYDHYPTAVVGDRLGVIMDVVDVRTGKRAPINGVRAENAADFAPAGNLLSFSRSTNGDETNGTSVYVTRDGRNAVNVRRKIGRQINAKLWAPDGKSLWLFGPDRDWSSAWFVSADGGRARRVALGGVSLQQTGNISRTNALAFVGVTANHPQELYYLASPGAQPVRLTNLNGWISSYELGRVVAVHWRNDGFNENGILTLPPHYDPNRSYPLVLIVHGGPQGANTIAYSAQNQITASHGYLVFNPNYRGSTNLGDAYEHAISRDAGDGPGRDVMAGIAAVERFYKVDRSRMAVTGWSYGGYMTSWMESHYNIWKAAVAGAALNDWLDDFNVSFYVYTDVPWFPGPPGNPKYRPMWIAQSPITYAQRIKAPTLIMGDIGDNNVTITNSFKMYHALKDNGVTAQFVAYPVHGHFPSDPAQAEDVNKRWLAWIDKYLGQVTK